MKLKRILALVLCFAMVLSTMSFNVLADEATGNVAKVGNTEYATIEEAINNWTNGTTLTLLDNVTLSDVIKLSSTEYHILDLGTYTMTAAKNKDAIQYVVNGRSSAGYALDIKADATNPGGITADGKTIVSHIKPSSNAPSKDRPITRFYGGVFNATYVVKQGATNFLGFMTSGYTGASAPYFQFYGGEYNGTIYTNRSQNQFHGGTFNGSMQMSVDTSSYTLIAGGTFKNLSNSMGSNLGEKIDQGADGYKFTIGSAKGQSDGSVCIDENGNYVITTTTPADAEASVASNYNSNNYFYYSTVNTNGMYYEDVYDALEGNKTGTVTVFTDELDLTDSSFTGTIVVPEGEEITIIVEEGTTPAWSVSDNANVTYTDDEGNELVEGEDGSLVEPAPVVTYVAQVGGVEYESVQEAINVAQDGDTVEIYAGEYGSINISNKDITIKGAVSDNGELLTTIKGGNPAITGHSFNGTIKDIKIVDAYKVMYAEPAGNVTVDNVYVTGATYGFHLVAYSSGLTWKIENSYMDLRWANSFGVYGDGYSDIIIRGNTFEATNPYYSDYGAIHVNSFLPSVTVEENIFGENARIYIDGSVTDTSKINISKNYHADGVENAFADDAGGVTVTIYQYYTEVDADGNLTGLVEIPVASPVAKIGDVEYETLEVALGALTSGATLELLSDVTIEGVWDRRKTGATTTVPFTFDGKNHKITFTGEIVEGMNFMSAFRFEADTTVKNLTIDMSAATTDWSPRMKAIAFKSNKLTVDNCTFIGNTEYTKSRAISFGESAGSDVGNIEVIVTNSTFIDWARGLTDNENGNDAKSVIATDNTFTNSSVYLSATDAITFTDNVLTDAWVNITSYTDSETLAVVATGNTLTANGTTSTTVNQINVASKNVIAQDGFYIPVTNVAEVNGVGYETLQAAVDAANEGDTITMIADVTLAESVTLPAGVTFNGNGKIVTLEAGTVLTFNDGTVINGASVKDGGNSAVASVKYYGIINFHGTNEMIPTDTASVGGPFHLVVNEDATLLINRFVLGYDRKITVKGTIEDAHSFDPTGKTPSLKFNSTSGVSVGGTGTGDLIVENAYVELDNSTWKSSYATHTWSFKNSYVSAASFGNNNAPGNASAAWNVTFDDSVLAAKNYIKAAKGVTYSLTNGSVATTNSLLVAGTLNIDETSSLTASAQQNNSVGVQDGHGDIAGTINVKGILNIDGAASQTFELLGGTVNVDGGKMTTGKMGLNLTEGSVLKVSADGSFTTNKVIGTGAIEIDAADMTVGNVSTITADVTDFTGTINAINNDELEALVVDGKITLVEKPKTYVAEVNGVGYETLQAAVDAAGSGDTIVLLSDIELSGTVSINKNITIDGDDKTITPADNFVSNGHNAAFVFEEGIETAAIKNITFNDFSGLSRVVRANFAEITIDNCDFNNNTVSEGVITSAYADLTVNACEFNNNTAGFAVINVGSDVNNGTEKVANITGNTFDGNSAGIAVVYAASSADVTGNYFGGNIHTGTNENAAAILAGPYTGNMSYTININENAFVNAMSKGEAVLPAVFAEDWSSLGSTTAFDLSSNYWNGNAPAEGYATSGENPDVTLDDYYTTYVDGSLGGLVKIATPVAQIGDTTFTSLQDAIDAAQDGDTIVVLADIDLAKTELQLLDDSYDTYFLVEGKTVTIDLNEKTISGEYIGSMLVGVFSTDNNGHLTISGNGTVDVTATGKVYSLFSNYNPGCSITIENGTYKLDKASNCLIHTAVSANEGEGNVGVIVNGGNFYLGNVGTGSNGSPWIFNANENGERHVWVTGGTFNADVFHQHYAWEVQYPDNKSAIKNNGDDTWTVIDAVAYIGRDLGGFTRKTGYATIADAIAAAQDGESVTLVEDITLNEGLTIAADDEIILDLCGKTVSYTSNVPGEDMITNKGNLTITDSSESKAGKLTYTNTDATASNVTVSTISCEPGSVLTITAGTVENKTVKADGSSIYSYAIDLLTNGSLGDVTVTINGGTVYSDYMAIRQFNNGDACKNTLTVSDGYIYGAKRAVQIHLKNNAAYTNITGGKIEGGDYSLCFLTTSENLVVSGGEFIGSVWYSGTDGFISGGTFSSPVAEEYCAAGYMPKDNGNGTYSVTVDPAFGKVAKIGDTYYEKLSDAIAAAAAGDTITLIADVTEDVTVNKSLTIDGANFKYTGNIGVSGKSTAAVVKNVNFVNGTGYAITTNTIKSITVENCTVTNYGYGFLYANKSTPTVVVKNVTVDGGNYGFHWVYGTSAALENVTMTNVTNGLLIQNYAGKTITLKNCDITNINIWERSGSSGVQAFKFEGANTVSTLSSNQYAEYVLAAADATLIASERFTVTTSVANSMVKYVDGTYKVVPAVAKIGETYYESVSEALAAVADSETVELIWAEGDAPIAMNGYVSGKTVTITGTAQVDWEKGFLFVGRTNDGTDAADATLIFDNATLTTTQGGDHGIHVSGAEKGSASKANGTVQIINSTINLSYLINKGDMTLDNSTLTVKSGFSIGGRPAKETVSGEDATATISLTNGSKVVVDNHNGMGLGYEAIGVMNIDATSSFETLKSFLVTAKGTMNIAGKATVAGTLTNNGSIVLTDAAATLTSSECGGVTTTVDGYKVAYADDKYTLAKIELFKFVGVTASLDSSLALNIYLNSSDLAGTDYYAIVEHTKEDGKVVETKIPYADWGTSTGYKAIIYKGVAAKEMADKLVITVYDADGKQVSESRETSLRDYAIRTLTNITEKNITAQWSWLSALTDMLNYGAAAQTYFGYNTDDFANVGAETFQEYASPSGSYTLDKEGCTSSGSAVGASVTFAETLELNFYFENVTKDMYAEYSYTTHLGTKIEKTVYHDSFISGYGYTGVVVPVAIADTATLVTVTLFNSNGSEAGKATYAVKAYLKDNITKPDAIFDALAKFATSAKTAFAKNN